MYNKFLFLLFFTFVVSLSSLVAQERELVILHTNDTHSQIDPFSYKGDTNVGGFLRREALIRQIRKKHPNVLLLDAGDFSQGTPYFNLFDGYMEVKLMNAMRYDVSALGNHEFDNGTEALAKRLRTAKFPVVCANYIFQNKALSKRVKPHVVIKCGGLKIGIFGLLADVGPLVTSEVASELTFLEPLKVAVEEVALLKSIGCDLIICLSHLGVDENTDNDYLLAEKVPDINLIIGGHSHKEFENPVVWNDTRIYQLANKGKCVGVITLQY